jgi:cystine transport system ATP-binding protein
MIRLTGIEKAFGTNVVLHGIDLEVKEGTVTALIGPSGGGKSTLLRCVNLLERPRAGRLELGDLTVEFHNNLPPTRDQLHGVRRRTGMVFQSFHLFPHRTALGNVIEGLVTVQGVPRQEAQDRGRALLERVGLNDKENAYPGQLSGGQQQRVAIARALAGNPRVLLCDEPTSALDPELAKEVVDVLTSLARDGVTMIVTTHDLRLAGNLAGQVAFLEAGRIVEIGTPEAVLSNPEHPRTQAFVSHLS